MRVRPRLVRRLSLALLVLWVGALVAVVADRQFRRRPSVAPVEMGSVGDQESETAVRVQKGFTYNDVLGVEPNFRITARETVEFASGWYEFRDIDVVIYRKGAVSYGVHAARARFNPTTRETIAEGDVQLSLGGGIAVRAKRVTLHGGQRALDSDGTVTFAGPGWGGIAGQLKLDLDANRLRLLGGVSASWRGEDDGQEAIVVLAPEARYRRDIGELDFPQGVRLLRGGLRLVAPMSALRVEPESGKIREMQFSAPVELSGPLDDGGRILMRAGDTTLAPTQGSTLRLTSNADPASGWVSLDWADAAGATRHFTTWRLVGEGQLSRWDWIEAQEMVCGTEVDGSSVRSLSAGQMRVAFTDGKPATVVAQNAVRLDLDGNWATGDILTTSLAGRTFNLAPSGKNRVAAGSAEAEAQSDLIEGNDNGEVQAVGHVVGRLRRPSDNEPGAIPTRFAADRARVFGETVVLDGDARLWQGDRLIRADRLRYGRQDEIVDGTGSVLTQSMIAGDAGTRETLSIRSRTLHYDRRAGRAEYDGNVIVEDPRAETECQSLTAFMDQRGNLTRADLDGGVRIVQRAAGREVKGDEAKLDAADNTVTIWGNPVVITETGGNQVSGMIVRWDRRSDSITVEGSTKSPSETIFQPQATPTAGPVKGKGRRP